MPDKKTERSCCKCGTKFTEKINTDYFMGPIDPIPECWKGDVESGHCIKCCNCYSQSDQNFTPLP